MWAFFDSEKADAGVLTEATGRIWYDELVGGLRELGKDEGPQDGDRVWGVEVPRTFRVNTQVYLQWYVESLHFSTSSVGISGEGRLWT